MSTTDVVASKFWTAKLSVSWSAGTLTLSLVKLAFPDIKGTVVTPSREGALERGRGGSEGGMEGESDGGMEGGKEKEREGMREGEGKEGERVRDGEGGIKE